MTTTVDFRALRGLVIDIDGTLFRGSRSLPGIRDFFGFLEREHIRYVVATNNTKSPRAYMEKFLAAKIDIDESHILTCATATGDWLEGQFDRNSRVYVIGQEDLKEDIRRRGFTLLSGREQTADLVVVGGDFFLDYEKLKNSILHVQDGARLIGTNPDLLIPTEEGLVPEAGTTLAAIGAATGIRPLIIGKPEPVLFDMAVSKMGLTAGEVAMVGDRLETDILGGKQAGLRTILLETGVDNRGSIRLKGIRPDLVCRNLVELRKMWEDSLRTE